MKVQAFSLTLLLLTGSVAASAQTPEPPPTRALAEEDALRLAVTQSPSLRAALLDVSRAGAGVSVEEDRYPLLLQLDGSADYLKSPSLASADAGGVQTSTNEIITLGSQLSKQFSFGTSLSFRLQGSYSRRIFPPLPTQPVQVTLGPGYDLRARLSVVQPLLRGFGDDQGEAALRAAKLDQASSESTVHRAASELLRDVLVAYWELWYASEAVRIEIAAKTLAEDEQENVKARIEAGTAAPVDVHSASTRVAELEESVATARFEQKRRALELGLLLGEPSRKAQNLDTAASQPPDANDLPPLQQLVDAAMATSPELAERDAAIAASQDRERSAGEPDRQRLDLEGWVQTEGLGNQQVPPAFEQFGTFGAFSAHLGLVYELPLTGSRYDSQKAAARHATESLEAQREATALRIESDIHRLHQQATVASRRVELAERTTEAAEAQLAAARDRMDLGGGLAIDVERAEDALRRARLRAVRARVDGHAAKLALDHATGQLLLRYAEIAREQGLASSIHVPPAPRGPF
ncbi:MAG: TolC family protein [Myxococcales bacterium]|nr:TolC family protein [Myxococcales bacterium]